MEYELVTGTDLATVGKFSIFVPDDICPSLPPITCKTTTKCPNVASLLDFIMNRHLRVVFIA
jgi:hypothetical protein